MTAAARPLRSGTALTAENASSSVSPSLHHSSSRAAAPHGRAILACRCGSLHQVRERAIPCTHCGTDTWDAHRVCARCRGIEAQLLAERGGDREAAP